MKSVITYLLYLSTPVKELLLVLILCTLTIFFLAIKQFVCTFLVTLTDEVQEIDVLTEIRIFILININIFIYSNFAQNFNNFKNNGSGCHASYISLKTFPNF